MNDYKRRRLEPLFNALNPGIYELSAFPPRGDDGDGSGDDADLASIIEMGHDPVDVSGWGGPPQIGCKQIEFAIKLGRALERAGISYDQE